MSAETTVDIVDAMQWRYATKQFDATKKIPQKVWQKIEQSLILTPSSFGLQPWKFVVITNQELKEKLVPFSWAQKQPAECSHFVVISRLDKMDEQYVDAYIARTGEVRNIPVDSLQPFRKMMVDFINGKSVEDVNSWMSHQAYIALGNLMTTASYLGVDNCPMEGFDHQKYDELLQLPQKGLRSVVCCALGYRHPEDRYAKLPKVRFDASELIIHE